MKPSPLKYHRASSVADVLERLHNDPDAKVLAGGQSLMPMLNFRLARVSELIDVGGLGELDRIFDDVDSVIIGARCTHRRLETDQVIARVNPLLRHAASQIGYITIRNRGTLGGSIAHADSAAELPAVLVAMDATIYVDRHLDARREVPAREFFESHFTTVLEPADLVTWIRVPAVRASSGWGFREIAPRHGDMATAGAVAVMHTSAGRVTSAYGALFGVTDRPTGFAVPQLLGCPSSTDREDANAMIDDAVALITAELRPTWDAALRRRYAKACLGTALRDAFDRSGGIPVRPAHR
ncbi:MAG TPA: FAD binding domain-containing protein [Solirubrobacteraceae bacterium]